MRRISGPIELSFRDLKVDALSSLFDTPTSSLLFESSSTDTPGALEVVLDWDSGCKGDSFGLFFISGCGFNCIVTHPYAVLSAMVKI